MLYNKMYKYSYYKSGEEMKKIGIIVNTHKTDNTYSVLKVVKSLKERADVYVVSDCAVDNVKLLSMDELV